jgi:hypothetical protein
VRTTRQAVRGVGVVGAARAGGEPEGGVGEDAAEEGARAGERVRRVSGQPGEEDLLGQEAVVEARVGRAAARQRHHPLRPPGTPSSSWSHRRLLQITSSCSPRVEFA